MVWPEKAVTPPQRKQFERLVRARAAGSPVAYLTGHRAFMHLDLEVGPGALVPRPETELLVDWAREFLMKVDPVEGQMVIDVGTGPATILLALATQPALAPFTFVGCDISPEALHWASTNRRNLDLRDRVHLVQGDMLSWFGGRARLITANLPYVRSDQIAANWELSAEPPVALDGGEQGTALIEKLIRTLPDFIASNGGVALEIDPLQSKRVAALIAHHLPWLNVTIHCDLAGLDRFVTGSPRSLRS